MLSDLLEKWKKRRIKKINKGFRKNTNNLLNRKVTLVQWRKIQRRLEQELQKLQSKQLSWL